MPFLIGKLELVFVISAVFCVAFFLIRRFTTKRAWPVLGSSIIWLLYAAWELYCTTGQYDIRIEMVIIFPILIIVSLWALSFMVSSMI